MISKERVKHMTKLASFEEGDGKKYRKMTQYFRGDYVSLEIIKSFITGTIAFFIMVGLWGFYSLDSLMENLKNMELTGFAMSIVLFYLCFMACYLLLTYVIYNIRYTRGRKMIRLFYNRIKKINRLYEYDGKLEPDDFE